MKLKPRDIKRLKALRERVEAAPRNLTQAEWNMGREIEKSFPARSAADAGDIKVLVPADVQATFNKNIEKESVTLSYGIYVMYTLGEGQKILSMSRNQTTKLSRGIKEQILSHMGFSVHVDQLSNSGRALYAFEDHLSSSAN